MSLFSNYWVEFISRTVYVLYINRYVWERKQLSYQLLTNSANTHNSHCTYIYTIQYTEHSAFSVRRSASAMFRTLNEYWSRNSLFQCVMLHKVLRVACCFTTKQKFFMCLVRFGTPNRTVRFDSARRFWMCLSIIIININNKLLYENRYFKISSIRRIDQKKKQKQKELMI